MDKLNSRYIRLFWCWVMLSLLIFSAGALFIYSDKVHSLTYIDVLKIATLFSGIFSIAIIRLNIPWWSRRLNITSLAILVGLFMATLSMGILMIFVGYNLKPIIIISVIIGHIGVAIGIWLSIRSYTRVLLLLLALAMAFIAIPVILAAMQRYELHHYAKMWSERGWAMDWKSVFKNESTRPGCESLFASMAQHADKEWKPFYDANAKPLEEEVVRHALSAGISIREYLLLDVRSLDAKWEQWKSASKDDTKAMAECPYLQWYSTEDRPFKVKDFKPPNLLPYIRWSKMQMISTLISRAKGEGLSSKEEILVIHDLSKRLRSCPQPILTGYVGIAIERMHIIAQVCDMEISGEPLDDLGRKALQDESMPDLSWWIDSLHCERYYAFQDLDSLETESNPWIPYKMILLRAAGRKESAALLENWTRFLDSFTVWVDPSQNEWNWSKYPKTNYVPSKMFPDLEQSPAIVLSLAAQARIALALDAVLRYRNLHNVLPDELDFSSSHVPVDPFTGKNMIYRKESETEFTVYSAGPDKRDNGGEKLYVNGRMEDNEDTDNDIGFRIALQ